MALILRQRPGCRLDELDGDFFLYHPQGESMVACSPQAALVWALCDGTRDVADLTRLLQDAWPDAVGRIAADVERVVDGLRTAGFLLPDPP